MESWDSEKTFWKLLEPQVWSGDQNMYLLWTRLECNIYFPAYHDKQCLLNPFRMCWSIYFDCHMSLRRWLISQMLADETLEKSTLNLQDNLEPGLGPRCWDSNKVGNKKSIPKITFTSQCKLQTSTDCLLLWPDMVKNSYVQPASKQIVVPCWELVQTTPSMAKWCAPALLKEGGQCSHVPTGTWQLKSNVPRVWCLSKRQCHLQSKGGLRCAGLEWGTQRQQLGEWEK